VKLCQRNMLSVAAKYGIKCLDVSVASVKLSVWETFAQFAATTVYTCIVFLLSVTSLYAFYYFLFDF